MKETIAHEYSPYKDVSDEDIEARILELKRKLGWPESASKILPDKYAIPCAGCLGVGNNGLVVIAFRHANDLRTLAGILRCDRRFSCTA